MTPAVSGRPLPGYFLSAVLPRRFRGRVCRLCRAPVDGYEYCYRCNDAPDVARPDTAGFVSYAIKNSQAGQDMYRYKGMQPSVQAVNNVQLLLEHGLRHLRCVNQIVGTNVQAVTVMPSRSHYQSGAPSQLQKLCALRLPTGLPTVGIEPVAGATSDRKVDPDSFRVPVPVRWSHVLLIDDTWVSGGTVMSAVGALRAAGAAKVSSLVLARWLDPGYRATPKLIREVTEAGGWNPPQGVCPFTRDGVCPRVR